MATYTTNYNLIKPEGTDAYNHLIYDNPNMDTIDAALKTINDLTVSRATCVKTGTNHAVTRQNTDAVIFRFTATGDFNNGDTMTVDGVSVSVFLPNGEAANTGAYIINSEVLAAIQGTRVTLYTNALNQMTADHITYDNTASGLTATNAQAALDEVVDDINNEYTGLNIVNSAGGAEPEKATLRASGKVGFLSFAFTCQNASQETLTISLPAGWNTIREGIVIRDNSDGSLVSVYAGSNGAMTTFGHVGNMTVGHLYLACMKVYK